MIPLDILAIVSLRNDDMTTHETSLLPTSLLLQSLCRIDAFPAPIEKMRNPHGSVPDKPDEREGSPYRDSI